MTDRILLTGVRAFGHHGVLPEERRDGQEFVADLVLHVDTAVAAASDDLDETVSYAEVAQEVVGVIGGEPCDLVETVAQRIADVALGHELVEAVEVTVHKPSAPVGVPFADVGVTIRRERDVEAVVALGANLADRLATVHQAVTALHGCPGVEVLGVSDLVETEPVGGPDQPAYLNAVARLRTCLAPRRLLAALHRIEDAHGRTREVRWGARTLDLDLITYGMPGERDEVRCEGALLLPHPRAHERAFVLAPWAQMEPDARLRVGADVVPVAQRLAEVGTTGVRPGPDWPAGVPGR